MERLFTVKAKHWWDYLNPRWYRRRRILQAVLDHNQEEFLQRYREHMLNLAIYGTSLPPEAFKVDEKNH